MGPKKLKQLLPSILSTLGLFTAGATLVVLCKLSRYTLFGLAGIFLLLLATVQLILTLFGNSPKDIKDITTTQTMGDNDPPPQNAEETEKKERAALSKILKRSSSAIAKAFAKSSVWLAPLLLVLAIAGGLLWFGAELWAKVTGAMVVAYWHLALVAIFFVGAVIGDHFCRSISGEDKRIAMLNRNACLFFKLTKIFTALLALPLTLSLLGIAHIHTYVSYAMAILFYYVGIMIVISLGVRVFKRELDSCPGVVVLLPFMGGDVKELAVLSFLEENTGITLRSLWSLKFIKSILPYSVIAAAILFWASTGIVYVSSHQQAAVYRLGTLCDDTLQPGLHLTLPYPIDRSEIYDTETVNKVTIGYKSTENQDNVWNEGHGDNEYRLLLGSGKELVSINLRIEYRISDLKSYLRGSASPDKILEAKAYELVTAKTINTDLKTILSTDRESFSNSFHQELEASLGEVNTGVDVISVVLESIHPPVEIADVYQNFIAAEIRAQRFILAAEATAAEILAEADTLKHQMMNYVEVDKAKRIAAATTEIAQFTAGQAASELYPEEYRYYKYLDAVRRAYKNARLVIVGNDVDSSRLYFGSIPTQDN